MTRMRGFTDLPPQAVQSIRAPALVVAGDRDVVQPEHAVEMFRLLPHAQLAILPGTDHMQIVQRGELLLSLVTAFLDPPVDEAR